MTHPTLKRALLLAVLLGVTGCKDLKIESDKEQYQFNEVASMWLLFKKDRVPDGVGSFTWKSNRDGVLGQGSTLTLQSLSAGKHEIRVEGTYNGKKVKSKTKKILITNEAPRAMIHAPLGNASYGVGTAVTFVGAANDLEDGQLSGSKLEWSSNKDGMLGVGSTITKSNLSPGKHRITLTATDAAGGKGSTSFDLEITNQAPRATIASPSGNTSIHVMEVLTLRGSAVDPDPVLGTAQIPATQLIWRSNKDGEIGRGPEVSVSDLSGGTHRITLEAADEFGEVGRASIEVEVINQPPTANITSPGDNQFFAANATITFHVDARDPETTLDENQIIWRSDKDGRFGRGYSVNTDNLSPGEHRITVQVTDRHGASVTDSIRVLVTNEAPVAQIEEPLNGAHYRFGERVNLRGAAVDREDGNVSSSRLSWTARNLNTGVETDLGGGNDKDIRVRHLVDRLQGFGDVQITLVAEDSDGTKSTPVSARIVLVNTEPTVRIASPTMGQTVSNPVSFVGFGQDPDRNQAISGHGLIWTARDEAGNVRQLGRGENVQVADLAPGRYRVTLTAVDPDDHHLRAEAHVRILVQQGSGTTTTTTSGGQSDPSAGGGLSQVVNHHDGHHHNGGN